jgi:hypothetical protein
VSQDQRIAEFIEKALAAGIPHQALVGVLTANGWPEKEVYAALADHYRRQTGIEIPRRAGSGASAKDAFSICSSFPPWRPGPSGLGAWPSP